MRYPTMGETRQYQLALPQMSGGVNYSVLPTLIDDNQLSDVKNLWFRDGVLKTRPGISFDRAVGGTYEKTVFGRYSTDETTLFLSTYTNEQGYKKTGIVFGGDGEVFDISDYTEGRERVEPWFCDRNVDGTTQPTMYYYNTDSGQSNLTGRVFSFSNGFNKEESPYSPTVIKSGVPKANFNDQIEGVFFEPFNLLTGNYKCEYTSNGEGLYFRLPKANNIFSIIVKVTNKRGDISEYSLNSESPTTTISLLGYDRTVHIQDGYQDKADGQVYLVADMTEGVFWLSVNKGTDPVKLGKTGLENDIVASVVCQNTDDNIKRIYGMRFSEWYGGGSSGISGGTRLFVSGNPEHPNLVHWSALNDPLYFPENNYAYVGTDKKKITAFGKQEDLLVIFKDGELYCTKYYDGQSVTYEQLENQSVIDIEAARAVFPIIQLHPSVGCDRPKTVCLCNNRLVWFNSDGKVYGLFSANQYSERNVRELSLNVEKELRAKANEEASAAEFENHYLLCLGNTVFAMDFSSVGFTYFASYSSDEKSQKAVRWYVWEFKERFDVFNQNGNVVFANKGNPVCLFSMNDPDNYEKIGVDEDSGLVMKDIPVTLSTKLFDFGRANRYKRINPFYLHIGGGNGKIANLTYLNEKGECYDAYQPIFTGENLLSASPIRVTPNAIRTRTFGIKIESNGYIEIGGMTLNYSLMGTVR